MKESRAKVVHYTEVPAQLFGPTAPGASIRWLIDGELTLHGMTSDVQLDTTYLGMQEWNGLRAGCLATTQLHREHFTVNWQQILARGVPVVGSTIEITLDVQAILQQ